MAQHTSAPWHVTPTHPEGQFRVTSTRQRVGDTAQLSPVATVYAKEDADLIVRAVNAHDALVSTLKAAMTILEVDAGCNEGQTIARAKAVSLWTGREHVFDADAAREVLAKAEGK